jgi:hypothetical protein
MSSSTIIAWTPRWERRVGGVLQDVELLSGMILLVIDRPLAIIQSHSMLCLTLLLSAPVSGRAHLGLSEDPVE